MTALCEMKLFFAVNISALVKFVEAKGCVDALAWRGENPSRPKQN
jgi:hypothetical protein